MIIMSFSIGMVIGKLMVNGIRVQGFVRGEREGEREGGGREK